MFEVPVYSKQQGVRRFLSTAPLKTCSCGAEPRLIQFFIKGVANRLNWFVKCDSCRQRTRRRKGQQLAIDEWNECAGSLYAKEESHCAPIEDELSTAFDSLFAALDRGDLPSFGRSSKSAFFYEKDGEMILITAMRGIGKSHAHDNQGAQHE